MPEFITHDAIQEKIALLNHRLGRPRTYFTIPNGKPSVAAVGHIGANNNANGYQLFEVATQEGHENVYLFGLTGERLDSRCFYVLLNVLLACAEG